MNKFELASYLNNLSSLLASQDAAGGNIRSNILAAEYDRNWKKLKEMIENETRSSESQQHGRNEAGAGVPRRES